MKKQVSNEQMDKLLSRIVSNTKTPDSRDETIHISSGDQLLALAAFSAGNFEKVIARSPEEEFSGRLFRELFREAGFFYRQYKASLRRGFPDDQLELVVKRLEIIVDAMEESFIDIKDRLLKELKNSDSSAADTIAFILSSLQVDRSESDSPEQKSRVENL